MHEEQKKGWNVGPECVGTDRAVVTKLGEAAAFAVMRSRHHEWRDSLGPTRFSDWCKENAPAAPP